MKCRAIPILYLTDKTPWRSGLQLCVHYASDVHRVENIGDWVHKYPSFLDDRTSIVDSRIVLVQPFGHLF